MLQSEPVGNKTYHAVRVAEPVVLGKAVSGGGGGYGSVEAPETQVGAMAVKYRDSWAALLFLAQVALIVYLGLHDGVRAVKDATGEPPHEDRHFDGDAQDALEFALIVCLGSALTGGLLSVAWARYAMNNSAGIINCSLWFNVFMNFTVCLLFMLVGSGVGAAVFLLLGMVNLCYLYMVKSRIPFAAANLRCACAALLEHTSLLLVALLLLLVQVLWLVVWGLAATAVYASSATAAAQESGSAAFDDDDADDYCIDHHHHHGQDVDNTDALKFFGLAVSFYWGLQVGANIVHMTVAGTVATWWFQGSGAPHAVSGSLYRALTTSFGSVCLGSLVVAFLQALRAALDAAAERDGGQGCVGACVRYLLGCIERLVEYFSSWAYVYCAIYGLSFSDAGHQVMQLFKERGWTAVINDDLTSTVLMLGSVVVGIFTAGISMVAVWMAGLPSLMAPVAVLGGLMGLAMAAVVMRTLVSGVRTVLVCFATDPARLSETHPSEYVELLRGWQLYHPTLVAWVPVQIEDLTRVWAR